MTPEQFAYWLQGFCELNQQPPTPEQWESIKSHLKTVFNKITPDFFISPGGPNYPTSPTPGDYIPPFVDPTKPTIIC